VEEIKMKKNFEARLPKIDPDAGSLTAPVVNEKAITGDWDYRNYSDDWLPSWIELKTKLISVHKQKQLSSSSNKKASQQLPVMFAPGGGTFPKVVCFGCGKQGHRGGDPECSAGPNEWADCAPKKFKAKLGGGNRNPKPPSGGGGSGGPSPNPNKRKGADGLNVAKSDGACHACRDTGKCKFGQNCRFKHVETKKVKLTKTQKKKVAVEAMKPLKNSMIAKAKEEGNDIEGNDLNTCLASLMQIRTCPRAKRGVEETHVPVLATSALLDVEKNVCVL
jgi:hypothetical protein